ncbi:MAG: AlpA family transcriptional regulator [Desulfobulbus sp.]
MHSPTPSQKLIRRQAVEQRTGLKRSHIYALMKQGAFPQAIPLAGRAVAWIADEVDTWITGRIKDARRETSHNVVA